MQIHLTDKKCVACEGGVPPLNSEQVSAYSVQVPEWKIAPDLKSISREFTFKNFKEAMAFANKIGDLAEEEGHHPELAVSWGKVSVHLTTHAIGGLSENDFIMAAKVDLLQ
ncbi:MAG: 4a-hydroxytetrahydrobiopterin dehydratase [Patescibacteria group bacterium]|nr:4a-hydroxytetrahydrobiopterin dehydratase [Patescibacteria group bacterium]